VRQLLRRTTGRRGWRTDYLPACRKRNVERDTERHRARSADVDSEIIEQERVGRKGEGRREAEHCVAGGEGGRGQRTFCRMSVDS
jgi:hypothetical protein